MKRWSFAKLAGTVGTALALALPAAASGGTATSVIPVSAAVQPSAIIRFEAKTAGVAVTQADIAAGYVDLPANSLLSLKTDGVAPVVVVEFVPVEGVFRSVEVVATHIYDAAAGGSGDPQRRAARAPAAQAVAAFSYRFKLSPNAVPGIYTTPITVRVDL